MANQYRSVLASSGPAPTGGDALPAEVLAGKTFTNDNGAQTGTMVNRGAVTETLTMGQSYTIPEGYHNGSGTVSTGNGILNTSFGVYAPNTGEGRNAFPVAGYSSIKAEKTAGNPNCNIYDALTGGNLLGTTDADNPITINVSGLTVVYVQSATSNNSIADITYLS